MSFYAPDIEISFHVNREERQGGWNLRQPGIPSTCSSFQPHARSVLLAPEMSLSPTQSVLTASQHLLPQSFVSSLPKLLGSHGINSRGK